MKRNKICIQISMLLMHFLHILSFGCNCMLCGKCSGGVWICRTHVWRYTLLPEGKFPPTKNARFESKLRDVLFAQIFAIEIMFDTQKTNLNVICKGIMWCMFIFLEIVSLYFRYVPYVVEIKLWANGHIEFCASLKLKGHENYWKSLNTTGKNCTICFVSELGFDLVNRRDKS
jgi:hypothetical protein